MANYENLIDRCKEIAEKAHFGQLRKETYEPYVIHPIRVASCFAGDIYKAVSLLHDVLEDTKVTENNLHDFGIPNEVIDCVKILSRKQNEHYYDFIIRIIDSRNDVALAIKLADIQDNMSDLREGNLKDKYRFAEHIISAELENRGLLKKEK